MTTVGVIGYGSAGTRHARLFAARDCDVLVADPAVARSDAAAADGHRPASEAELLATAEVVVVASPNHLHARQLTAAVEASRDVLVEKPIAVEPDPALEATLSRAAEQALVVGVGCNLRFVPAIELLKELVEEGSLGQILRVRADFGYDLRRWRPDRDVRESYSARPEEGGGILLDAIHEFDYLHWIFGPATRIACIAGSRTSLHLDVEDVACAVLDFQSGAVGEVALDYGSAVYRRGFEVVGDEASASWRWPSPSVTLTADAGPRDVPVAGPESMYERLVDDFLDAVARRRAPRTPGTDGVAVLGVVAAARESAASGRHVEVGA